SDDPLAHSVVADRPSRSLDAARQRGLTDEPVPPHLIEQLLLGDHAVAVAEQVDEDIEDLRLDRHRLAVAAKLEALNVELAAIEGEAHRRSLHRLPSRTRADEAPAQRLRAVVRRVRWRSSSERTQG